MGPAPLDRIAPGPKLRIKVRDSNGRLHLLPTSRSPIPKGCGGRWRKPAGLEKSLSIGRLLVHRTEQTLPADTSARPTVFLVSRINRPEVLNAVSVYVQTCPRRLTYRGGETTRTSGASYCAAPETGDFPRLGHSPSSHSHERETNTPLSSWSESNGCGNGRRHRIPTVVALQGVTTAVGLLAVTADLRVG